MCDHCGCREFSQILELHEEHEQILEMAWAIVLKVESGARLALDDVRDLVSILDIHVAKEEFGLYPKLVEVGELGESLLDELEAEHVEIRRTLMNFEYDRKDYFELAAHIETEEEELFPLTVFSFDDDDWGELEALERTAQAAEEAHPHLCSSDHDHPNGVVHTHGIAGLPMGAIMSEDGQER